MNINIKLDMELLARQKARLVEILWDIDPNDEVWGIVDMIDFLQDELE